MPRDAAAPQQDVRVQPADFWRWAWASVRPVVGYVLAGLGFVLLLIAYFGVSREVLVAKQLPYLVSGGLFGLAFVTFGSRLILIEDLRRDSGRLDRLERLVEDLSLALLTRPDSPVVQAQDDLYAADVVPAQSRGARAQGRAVRVVDRGVMVLRGGTSFHREDCSVVAGKAGSAVDPSDARAQGLRACRLCQPLATRTA